MKIDDTTHPQVRATTKVLTLLDDLTLHRRGAFGASCAERLFPIYAAFSADTSSGHPGRLREAIDSLWEVAIHATPPAEFPEDVLWELLPALDDHASNYAMGARYAVSCVIHASRSLREKTSDEAAWCSIVSRDCISDYLQWSSAPCYRNPDERVRDEVAAIDWFAHPLMQHEMRKQFADLNILRDAGQLDEATAFALRVTGARGIAPFERKLL